MDSMKHELQPSYTLRFELIHILRGPFLLFGLVPWLFSHWGDQVGGKRGIALRGSNISFRWMAKRILIYTESAPRTPTATVVIYDTLM